MSVQNTPPAPTAYPARLEVDYVDQHNRVTTLFRVVLIIDRDVVRLYPRIVFLELPLGIDYSCAYLRNRPRGDTERSFIEKAMQIQAANPADLWTQIDGQFMERDFPADRRITAHFKRAAYLSIALFWIIAAIILQPTYFPIGG